MYRLSLEKEKFPKVISDPIEYGIQRTVFKKDRLRKLIGVGKGVKSRTVQAKIERWKRQLQKLDHSQEHLVSLKRDLDATRSQMSLGGRFPSAGPLVTSEVPLETGRGLGRERSLAVATKG